ARLLSFSRYLPPPDLPSFPTRRSSDLGEHALVVPDAASIGVGGDGVDLPIGRGDGLLGDLGDVLPVLPGGGEVVHRLEVAGALRSEEHTSELQSRFDLVCRLLLEKKNI